MTTVFADRLAFGREADFRLAASVTRAEGGTARPGG